MYINSSFHQYILIIHAPAEASIARSFVGRSYLDNNQTVARTVSNGGPLFVAEEKGLLSIGG